MVILDGFSVDEREILVSLPYLVGLWIIDSNETVRSASRSRQRMLLETIIVERSRRKLASAFVQEVMKEACCRRADWERWRREVADVPAACARARVIIADRLGKGELESYRRTVMAIATAMANAFQEPLDNHDAPPRSRTWLERSLERLTEREPAPAIPVTPKAEELVVDAVAGADGSDPSETSDFLNTSDREHLALATLNLCLTGEEEAGACRE